MWALNSLDPAPEYMSLTHFQRVSMADAPTILGVCVTMTYRNELILSVSGRRA